MADAKRVDKSERAGTAEHAGTADRDGDRLPPGSGLHRRQDQNAAQTDASARDPERRPSSADAKAR